MPQHYPFSAVLGCETDALDDMGLALVLTTISPEIGGVLVRGEKGTAKSTTVRALAAVLPPIDVYAGDRFSVDPADPAATSPDGPFGTETETIVRPVRLVELPVGATEDRVLGSLHLERALSHGKVEYEPGLLARAHRGILYVDEVNLLHDHLVDLLLDAAAMGQVTVERDGVSVEHAARFVLIGTMNPEEGELRPQLLDRFGLTVEVAAPREPALRAEVVRRRVAYDADPVAFTARYRDTDRALTERVETARERLAKVRLTESALMKIAEVCATFEVDGLRADIVTARTAVAHAAWEGRDEVTRADIRRAALLALPHRRRRNPFDAPGLDEDLLDQILGDDELPPEPPEGPAPDEPPTSPEDNTQDQAQGDGQRDEAADGDSDQAPATDDTPPESDGEPPVTPPAVTESGSTVRATAPYRPRLLKVQGLGEGAAGRRSRALASTGRRVGARRPDGPTGSLHLAETLLAAAGKQSSRGRTTGRVELRNEDLRVAVREGREANLVLFCVDASGSMAARKRMTQVKTAILSLLLDAYRRRDKVGLVTFRGAEATVALPPTHSVDIAAARLDEVPAGGRTPLAEGLLEAARVLTRERMRDPRLRPLLVLVTDGRATGGKDAVARSQQAAEYVAGLGVTTVVIDGESGPLRLGLALRLAELLRAEHLPVAEVSAEALAGTVRSRTQKGAA
ncbi:magnesium chelatase [Tessaracoccus lapidicaptus]|uniref:Mg-protoporphyrin IX chelatase n=1 Tax=Tessaracoccus lapidicaptus TaxID=1427523 RepID=A0A1C0AMP6_9ACTN|nr:MULTISPECIES: VWA domain-containing protein [Tessaracoccus]AQX14778.1 magnesium chelatase [Tessaracoccus sp. T2.5-30]OCL34563.1 magnesium chelatase [Tessaracoccus lapidicaptus]VEP38878.1 Magnesium-chelatase 38 kDa subunit [Tessaracoccus lapidicaptus]